MNRRKVLNIVLLTVIIFVILGIKNYVYAAGSFSVKASKTTVNVGDKVTISVTGSNAYGQVNISANNATLSASSVFLQNDTKTVTLTATSAGTITVNATPSSSGLGDGDENPITGTKTASITVNGNTQNSSSNSSNSNNSSNTGNANSSSSNSSTSSSTAKLSNITVSPVDFTGFRRDNPGPYRVTVENNVTSVKVSASGLNGSKGVVSGGSNLQEGTNKITVTAYSGNTAGMVYTIYVTRKAASNEDVVPNEVDKEETEEEEEENKVLRLNNIILDDSLNVVLDPIFDPEIFEYTVILGNDYLDLEELLINAVANIEDATITIDGNKDLIDGDNIVTITLEADGYETVWYRIKVVKGAVEEPEEVMAVNAEPQIEFDAAKILRNKIIISGGTLLIALFGIFFLIKECRESRNKNKEEEKSSRRKENRNRYRDEDDNDMEKENEDFVGEDDYDNLNQLETEENVGDDDHSDQKQNDEQDTIMNEENKNDDDFESNNILADIYNKKNPYNDIKNDFEDNNNEIKNDSSYNFKDNHIERLEFTEEKPKRKRRGKGKHA